MLRKLMKYEFKACSRIFLPIYLGILLVSSVYGLLMNDKFIRISDGGYTEDSGIYNFQMVLSIVLFSLFVALAVITILLTVQRFKRNLLEDEGYLMFTLPVSVTKLVLSKYLVALVFIIFSIIVAIMSFVLMIFFTDMVSLSDSFRDLLGLELSGNVTLFTILMIFQMFISYTIFIFNIYLSITIGQFPIFNKHRAAVGFVSFFLINTLISWLQNLLNNSYISIIGNSSTSGIANSLFFDINGHMWPIIIINTLIAVILFGAINFILNKKLNLE